jgi:hypothetical protein
MAPILKIGTLLLYPLPIPEVERDSTSPRLRNSVSHSPAMFAGLQ